ncbi:hypothetical protein [Ensifer adhaerens]|uniref:hypothetical protein n=1 Tax=Ensifer adhaerens TaxID=106592 RepID=UPI0008075958|nr:hypothetical protein [Ensifer adhaerens]
MIHHLAELIEEAERATGTDRPSKVAAAIETILIFWDHRSTVDRIDPLRDLKPILRVIKTLDPDENRWAWRYPGDGHRPIADVYSALRELVIVELVRQTEDEINIVEASRFCGDTEVAIVDGLNLWLADYQKQMMVDNDGKQKKSARKIDPKSLLLEKIESARHALDALADEINGIERPATRISVDRFPYVVAAVEEASSLAEVLEAEDVSNPTATDE